MRQFDIFENPSSASRAFAPFVVVLQSHHLNPLETVIVAPAVRDAKGLPPVDIPIAIGGDDLVLAISELGVVTRSSLKTQVGDAAELEDQIRRALDRMFTGF